MPIAQAFVIVSGLVLAVFGFLYIVWRSTAADPTASFLGAIFSAISASMQAGIGTFFLLVREPNLLIGVGVGLWAYASAFKGGFMAWHHYSGRSPSHSTFKAMFHFYSLGNVVAGCLAGIGCLAYGGAVGAVGASLSAYCVVLHLWLLNRPTREEARPS
jgi:hypothetical protein